MLNTLFNLTRTFVIFDVKKKRLFFCVCEGTHAPVDENSLEFPAGCRLCWNFRREEFWLAVFTQTPL
ncbi:hypothetical protein FKM82_017085 [Ascaphus truei]